MKHCILVKWNALVLDKKAMLPEIKLFLANFWI